MHCLCCACSSACLDLQDSSVVSVVICRCRPVPALQEQALQRMASQPHCTASICDRINFLLPLQEKALRRLATLPKKMLPLRLQVFKQFLLRTNLLTPARKAAAVGAGVQLPTSSAFTGPPVQLAPPSRECSASCWLRGL